MIADDARIGYPPARVWGVPTTALWAHRIGPERAKRLLFTGDLIDGRRGARVGPRDRGAAAGGARRALRGAARAHRAHAREPARDDKLLVNQTLYAQGLHATQMLGTVFDGIARHTPEGYAFQQRAAEAGFKQAVRERDEPFDG